MIFGLVMTTHAQAMKPDCKIVFKYLQTPIRTPVPEEFRTIFGKSAAAGDPNIGQTFVLMLQLDTMLESAYRFESSLPRGPITPAILEEKIAFFSDEFAFLPTQDKAELNRIRGTREGMTKLLASRNLPPALRTRIEDYRSTILRLGLEPGLPFSNVVTESLRLPGI